MSDILAVADARRERLLRGNTQPQGPDKVVTGLSQSESRPRVDSQHLSKIRMRDNCMVFGRYPEQRD